MFDFNPQAELAIRPVPGASYVHRISPGGAIAKRVAPTAVVTQVFSNLMPMFRIGLEDGGNLLTEGGSNLILE